MKNYYDFDDLIVADCLACPVPRAIFNLIEYKPVPAILVFDAKSPSGWYIYYNHTLAEFEDIDDFQDWAFCEGKYESNSEPFACDDLNYLYKILDN